MGYNVTQETFKNLTQCWKHSDGGLRWGSIFVLPVWLEAWWRHFKPESELYLSAVKEESEIIGIAPLQLNGEEASFLGSPDVFDYMDFVVLPGMENGFFNALLDDLRGRGIRQIKLEHVRPDSAVMTRLMDIAEARGYEVSTSKAIASLELDLPSTWEGYLAMLSTKQRHEVRRKLRRLGEMGHVSYQNIRDSAPVDGAMEQFLKFFTGSRSDKAAFMTEQMEAFFRDMAGAMADAGLLNIGTLGLDSKPTAMVMYFDYNDNRYLYNSGYDASYDYLSVGLLSKVLCIKDSIERKKKKFDFMKGDEIYKYLLGGKEVPLYSCLVAMK